ncbi:hypothetical protein ACIPXL_28720, partial [Streptomyces sp. NPDC090026]
ECSGQAVGDEAENPTARAVGIPLLQEGEEVKALTFVVFTAYGLCAAAVRDRVLARPRVLTGVRGVIAACFVGLGARLAVA